MTRSGAPSAGIQPGTVVAGRYRIIGEVGRGGMATVYRAHDVNRGVDVALKVLRPELAAVIGAERFAREVRITATLVHPHIIPILDSGEHEKIPFYVMPFVAGETLDARLKREQMLGVDESVQIITDVAGALQFAHDLGFVHRDVKPSNILVAGGTVFLSDFGIARAMTLSGGEAITDSGIALGTASYMSPEQGAGEKADARSDVYSLGCVLYELLAGTPPFAGPTQAVLARHALDTAASLLTIRPSVTPALDREIQRALAKVPGDRHASARAFADAVVAAKSDTRPASAFTTASVAVAPASNRRRIALVAAIAAVIAAIAIPLTKAGPGPVDAHRVVVFPLAVPEGTTITAGAGEDVATIIGSALGGTEPLRWVDGWTALDPAQRNDVRAMSLASLRSAARANRAGFMISGRLLDRGDSIAVALSLYDVAGDSLVAERAETGGRAEPWRQAVRALNALLPSLIPNAARDVQADWLGRPPAAIASFLLGESSFRRADPATALDHYAQALHQDSSFALAAFRGAQAASWLHNPARGTALLDSVAGIALPPKFADFGAGLRAYLVGNGDSAVAAFRRAVAADAEFAEAWTQLGESYTHMLPTGGTSDALADSAFSAAHRLDPLAANVLFHMIEIRLRAGDARGARPLLAAYLAVNADPPGGRVRQFELMQRCVEKGGSPSDWNEAAATAPQELLNASIALAGGDAPPRCAWDMLTAILTVDTSKTGNADNRRYFALLGRVNMFLAAGKADAASAEVDAFAKQWGYGASLFLFFREQSPALAARASAVMTADSTASGPMFLKVRSRMRLWALGGVALAEGRRDVATGVQAELRRRADSTHVVRDGLYAQSLAAKLALAAGDTARAIAHFEALVRVPVPADTVRWGDGAALGFERLTLARLYLARGAFDKAGATAETVLSAWSPFLAGYRADALDLARRAAEGRGEAAAASAYASRLAALRSALARAAQ